MSWPVQFLRVTDSTARPAFSIASRTRDLPRLRPRALRFHGSGSNAPSDLIAGPLDSQGAGHAHDACLRASGVDRARAACPRALGRNCAFRMFPPRPLSIMRNHLLHEQ
jgi:hypothetical protein